MRPSLGFWAGATGIAAGLLAIGVELELFNAAAPYAVAAFAGISALLGIAAVVSHRTRKEPEAELGETVVPATVVGQVQARFDAGPAVPLPRPPEPTSDPSLPYDLYVSYARADNRAPSGQRDWVQALLRRLNQARRRVGAVSDYNVCFDTSPVKGPADWEVRLSAGLHASSSLLALLSPRWLASDVCHREWRAFVDRGSDPGLAPCILPVLWEEFSVTPRSSPAEISAWFEGLPEDVARPDPDDRSVATEVHERVESVLGYPVCDLSLFGDVSWPELMAHEGIEPELEQLARRIDVALHEARRQARAPHDPFFVGRREELTSLRSAFPTRLAVVGSTQTEDGLGRSSLIAHHALECRADYPGGVHWLSGRGHHTLAGLLAPLAAELGCSASVSEVLGALRTRSGPRGGCLLVLHQVEDPELLRDDTLAPFLDASWVHVAVVADGSEGAGKRRTVVHIPPLPIDDAIELVRRRLPGRVFASEQERSAAGALARHLGGRSVAIQAASVELGVSPPHRCVALLQRLEEGEEQPQALISRHRHRLPWTPASLHTMKSMEVTDDP